MTVLFFTSFGAGRPTDKAVTVVFFTRALMQTGLERRLCSVALHESLYASRPTEKAVNFGGASCERRPGAGWNQPVKKCLPVEEKPKTR